MNRSTLFAWMVLFGTCMCISQAPAPDTPGDDTPGDDTPGDTPADRKPFSQKVKDTLVTFDMMPIPAGTFSPSTAPDQRVQVKAFYMSSTEITWDLFRVYAYSLDRTEQEIAKEEQDIPDKAVRSRPSKPYGDPTYGRGGEGFPATAMTFKSASGFCKWFSEKTGRKYRLPTEIEWEYAARAGGPVQVDPQALPDLAWHKANSEDATQAVATRKANPWGLHDMLGNVAEWCTDADGKAITRGGSHRTKARDLTYARRDYEDETWNKDPQDPKSTWWFSGVDFVGFRIVCEE